MNRIIRLGLAALLVSTSAGIASAADVKPVPDPARDANGTFEASGSGTVTINGRQTTYGLFTGRLVVRVPKGTAAVRIQGVPQKLVRGADGVAGFTLSTSRSRALYVRGAHVRLTVTVPAKKKASISSFGTPRILLRGVGTYRVNGGGLVSWPNQSRPVAIAVDGIPSLLPASRER